MARIIRLKLTGQAETFINRMADEGLTERDVFARALSILQEVYQTKRVGLVAPGHEHSKAVQFIYGINVANQSERVSKPPTQKRHRQKSPQTEKEMLAATRTKLERVRELLDKSKSEEAPAREELDPSLNISGPGMRNRPEFSDEIILGPKQRPRTTSEHAQERELELGDEE